MKVVVFNKYLQQTTEIKHVASLQQKFLTVELTLESGEVVTLIKRSMTVKEVLDD